MPTNTDKKFIRWTVLLLILAVILFVAAGLVTGNAKVVNLAIAPPLAGEISQSIGGSSGVTLPVEGKDYTITQTAYFETNTWAVATITNSDGSNTSYIVLQKVNGVFQVILGPGTAFAQSDNNQLPASVQQYLQANHVLIYQPGSA